MKGNILTISLLLSICSCTEFEFITENGSVQNPNTTRSAGDGEYDVLGYGYDVTGEYLHPMSVRNPVLDIERYKQNYRNRLITGSTSFGFDQAYYGYSASDYVKNIVDETNVKTSLNYGKDSDSLAFSGNIINNDYLKSEYAYSDKYSFASVDAVRNRKYIRINDEISRLSDYLSPEFTEDLYRLSADRIIQKYGTHVLTDFIIGGRYKIMYRSVITYSKDANLKKKTITSGFKATLKKIGFSLNVTDSEQIDESLVKNNTFTQLYVLFYGGNGTNLKYDLEKRNPSSIDIQSWENSISLGNVCLNNINWEETYPIFEFISDPIKKEEIKNAMKRYLESSRLNIIELLPIYGYEFKWKCSHLLDINPNTSIQYPDWGGKRLEGYILKKQLPGTVPIYIHYNEREFDYYTTTKSYAANYESWGAIGYVYKSPYLNTIPLYEYYHPGETDHTTDVRSNICEEYPGWQRCKPFISGYIYPKE